MVNFPKVGLASYRINKDTCYPKTTERLEGVRR